VPHLLAALIVCGALLLTTQFVFSRFPIIRWRLPAAIATAFMVGCSVPVVQFGSVQAYGMCLFLSVASFRVALVAVARPELFWSFGVGLLAGAAAASSLLTAPVAPVLLVWLLFYNRVGNRWSKFAAMVLGSAIPFIPVLWLLMKAPSIVFFNIIEYQLFYRRVNWGSAGSHDFDVLTAWIDSSPVLIMGLLAIAGVLFLRRECGCDRAQRAEFYLAAWLAALLTVHLSFAHPTFERYFLLAVPFYAVLASAGLYAVSSRFGWSHRPLLPTVFFVFLLCVGLGRRLFDDRNSYRWDDYQKIADKVDQVTPPGASLWADEVIYFLTRRPPPPGMEFSYSHKLNLPAARAASLHIMPQREIDRRVKQGGFATVATCADDEEIERLGLRRVYAHQAEISECHVFWDRRQSPEH
jgi:hypothetical protein